MTDFLGTEIKSGMYCAYPGKGNVNAEYGMILYKIIEVNESTNKIKAGRLYVEYGHGSNRDKFSPAFSNDAVFHRMENYTIAIKYKVSTISSPYKFVVVYPDERIKAMIEAICSVNESVFNLVPAEDIAKWIHGKGAI